MLATLGGVKHFYYDKYFINTTGNLAELWLRPEHMGLDPARLNVGQMQYLRIKDWLVDGAWQMHQ